MRKIALVAIAILLAGCDAFDSMKEGFTHTDEVATDLEKSVGSKPSVGFHWSNGSLTSISVTFKDIPAGKSTPEIAVLARNSIANHFKQEPEKIIISFALSGTVE